MIDQIQETATRIIYSSPTHVPKFYQQRAPDTTSGQDLYGRFLVLGSESDSLRPAWEVTDRLTRPVVAQQATDLLSIIREMLLTFRAVNFQTGSIPILNAAALDDGAVLFEWITADYRLGFNLDPEPQKSSWFLATSRRFGRINAYGFLSHVDLNKTLLWLLNFVISHSQP